DSLPSASVTVVGDINGDGLLDLGVLDCNGLFYYAIQDTDGTFTQAYATGIYVGNPNALFLQDVNGDFRPDLVFGASGVETGVLGVALTTGAPGGWFTGLQWSARVPYGGPYNPPLVALGDVDGNGVPDLVVTGTPTNPATTFGIFDNVTSFPAPP